MVSCTGPPALGDKWQNSTFHPLPSLYLSAVHIPTESASESTVGRMDEGSTAEGFIEERSVLTPPACAFDPRRWKFSFYRRPADKLLPTNITGSCKTLIVN